MNALVVYGSPAGKESGSYRLGSNFAKGMAAAGWTTDEVIVYEEDIQHCLGCRNCWMATPEKCVQDDAMRGILERQKKADALILAMPLYFFTIPGKMKDYVDRQMPLFFGSFMKAIGRLPQDTPVWPEGKKVVLISPCGFPGRENFGGLSRTMQLIYRDAYAGELLIPFGGEISGDKDQTKFASLYEVLRAAGEEFGRTGAVSKETLARFAAAGPDPGRRP